MLKMTQTYTFNVVRKLRKVRMKQKAVGILLLCIEKKWNIFQIINTTSSRRHSKGQCKTIQIGTQTV